MILLTGVDYPFGYVLVEPGTAERISRVSMPVMSYSTR